MVLWPRRQNGCNLHNLGKWGVGVAFLALAAQTRMMSLLFEGWGIKGVCVVHACTGGMIDTLIDEKCGSGNKGREGRRC